MAEAERRGEGGNAAIDRMKMALQMSERDPSLRGISEGLSPVVGVLDEHEGRLNSHDAHLSRHEDGLNLLARIAQDHLNHIKEKRDKEASDKERDSLFSEWNKNFDGLDDAGKKDMEARGKFLRDDFLKALKLGAPGSEAYEGKDPDDAVRDALYRTFKDIKGRGADMITVLKQMADNRGFNPEEIAEAIGKEQEPGTESLDEQGGDTPSKDEDKLAAKKARADEILSGKKKDTKPKNPDPMVVRARAMTPPENKGESSALIPREEIDRLRKSRNPADKKKLYDAIAHNGQIRAGK